MPAAVTLKVLIVDDQNSVRQMTRMILEEIGVRTIHEADNGKNAMAVASVQPLDLVISDFNMPEMDGIEFLRNMRGHPMSRKVPFILLTGRARVLTADSRGREVILAVLQPGDYVGEMSLIDNEPHSATCRAEVQTDMLTLGRTEFARCLPENSSMSYAIMKGLVQRLRQADRKIESLALMDVYGRVARVLLDLSDNVDGKRVVGKAPPKQEIARMIGASREMVSRVMKDLQTGGYIEMRGSTIVLRDTITLPE